MSWDPVTRNYTRRWPGSEAEPAWTYWYRLVSQHSCRPWKICYNVLFLHWLNCVCDFSIWKVFTLSNICHSLTDNWLTNWLVGRSVRVAWGWFGLVWVGFGLLVWIGGWLFLGWFWLVLVGLGWLLGWLVGRSVGFGWSVGVMTVDGKVCGTEVLDWGDLVIGGKFFARLVCARP